MKILRGSLQQFIGVPIVQACKKTQQISTTITYTLFMIVLCSTIIAGFSGCGINFFTPLPSKATTTPTVGTQNADTDPLAANTLTPTKAVAVGWSPDSRSIAMAVRNVKEAGIWVWDVAQKQRKYVYPLPGVTALAWSHDGTRIAAADDNGNVHIWDAANGHRIHNYQFYQKKINALAWSPDDERIASASDDATVKIRDVSDGAPVYTYSGHQSAVNSLAWSPDGTQVVSAANDKEHKIQIWEAITGKNVSYYSSAKPYKEIYAVAWSADGRIASSGDQEVHIWDAATRGDKVSIVCSGNQGTVRTLAWSPGNSRYIASGGDDNAVEICDTTSGKVISSYIKHHNASVTSLSWSSDGGRIASVDSGNQIVQVWEALSGKLLFLLSS
jgi:WD40 repeat protein